MVNSLVIKKVTNWTDCSRMTGAFAFAAFAFASIEGRRLLVFGAQVRFCAVPRFCRWIQAWRRRLFPEGEFLQDVSVVTKVGTIYVVTAWMLLCDDREAFRILTIQPVTFRSPICLSAKIEKHGCGGRQMIAYCQQICRDFISEWLQELSEETLTPSINQICTCYACHCGDSWAQTLFTCPFLSLFSVIRLVYFSDRPRIDVINHVTWLEIQDGADQGGNWGFRASVSVCKPETRHKTLVAIFIIYSSNTTK